MGPTPMSPLHVVVMGVTGTGKTTVALELRDLLGWDLAEGDDFHPPANVVRMSAGQPLTDEDRAPWLESLAGWARDHDLAGRPTLMTCSALRRHYRDVLRTGGGRTTFVHLVSDRDVLAERLAARTHFMPASLLASQLDTLEDLDPDESGLVIDSSEPPEWIAERVIAELGLA